MKKCISLLLTLAIAAMFVACSEDTEVKTESFNYFNAKVKLVADKPLEKLEVIRRVPNTENYNAQNLYVSDSMIFIYSVSAPESWWFTVLNIETGEEIGKIGRKGRGPNEFNYVFGTFIPVKQDGDLKSLMQVRTHEGKQANVLCNVTKSLQSGQGVYEREIDMPSSPLLWIDSERIMGEIPPKTEHENIPEEYKSMFSGIARNQVLKIMPQCFIYSLSEQRVTKKYDQIYSQPAYLLPFDGYGKPISSTDQFAYMANKAVNPSRGKLVLVGSLVPQINILDLKSGKMEAVRVEGLPLASNSESASFYNDVQCDDKYIYALYQGPQISRFYRSYIESLPEKTYPYPELSDAEWKEKGGPNSQLHIFDWSGKLVARYELEGVANNLYLTNGRIFTHRRYSGAMFEYNLKLK